MTVRRCSIALLALGVLVAGLYGRAIAFPVDGDQTTLPPKTELNEDALDKPREVFRSEFAGGKSYMINLGNLAFSSPGILGGVARQAAVSCGTCHVNGAGNAKFFVPKMSTRPGNFDTTGPLFNPKADNFVLDAVRIPPAASRITPASSRRPNCSPSQRCPATISPPRPALRSVVTTGTGARPKAAASAPQASRLSPIASSHHRRRMRIASRRTPTALVATRIISRFSSTAAALFASPHTSASRPPAINIDNRSGQWRKRN